MTEEAGDAEPATEAAAELPAGGYALRRAKRKRQEPKEMTGTALIFLCCTATAVCSAGPAVSRYGSQAMLLGTTLRSTAMMGMAAREEQKL